MGEGRTPPEARRQVPAPERIGVIAEGEPYLNRTRHGMDFLGMRVFPKAVHLNRRSKTRFLAKVRGYEWQLACGTLSEADFQERVTALTAFVQQADTLEFRQHFFRESAINVGIEPDQSGRQLEQQREQRAVWQREREQPGQREQQHRFPFCIPLSTMRKLEERMWYPPVSCFQPWNKERMAA